MKRIIALCIAWLTIVVGLLGALGGFVTSCSSNPVKWDGQGLTFVEAANKAFEERLRPSQANPFGFFEGPVSFKYDDGGVQRKGWITVYFFKGSFGWFVAPGQCPSAPAGYCDAGIDATIHDRTDEFSLMSAPLGEDCSTWPTRCRLVGMRYEPLGDPCDWIVEDWCPVWECFSGCPPDKAGT